MCAYGLLNTAYYTLCFLVLAYLRRRSGKRCPAPLSSKVHFSLLDDAASVVSEAVLIRGLRAAAVPRLTGHAEWRDRLRHGGRCRARRPDSGFDVGREPGHKGVLCCCSHSLGWRAMHTVFF